MDINPCIACGKCADVPDCIFRDDLTPLYDALIQADIITVSSPIFFSSLPGPLKNLIDRCQLIWEMRRRTESVPPKRGYFMASAGGNYPGVFTGAITVIRHFFNTLNTSFDENDYVLLPDADKLSVVTDEATARLRAAAATLR